MDVVAPRLEGRDVKDLCFVRKCSDDRLPKQAIDRGQKSCQRFAGAGRRRKKRMIAASDRRPALSLSFRRRTELLEKPISNNGMKKRQRHLAIICAHALLGMRTLTDE